MRDRYLTLGIPFPREQRGGDTARFVTAAAPAVAERRPSRVPAVALGDVLVEQMEYLLDHGPKPCPPGCPECFRLERVITVLLERFQ